MEQNIWEYFESTCKWYKWLMDIFMYVGCLPTDDWHWCKAVLCKLIYSNNTCTNWAACIVCTTTERYFMRVMRCCKIVTVTSEQMFTKDVYFSVSWAAYFSHCMFIFFYCFSFVVCVLLLCCPFVMNKVYIHMFWHGKFERIIESRRSTDMHSTWKSTSADHLCSTWCAHNVDILITYACIWILNRPQMVYWWAFCLKCRLVNNLGSI